MAQVGRISGGVLQDNLKLLQDNSGKEFLSIRSEIGDTSLLYFDAVNKRIGVDLENPSRDLTVKTKMQSVNSSSDIWELPVYTIQNNELEVNSGEIYLTATPTNGADASVVLSGLTTDDIKIDNERISTYNSNANLDLIPNGTGTVEFLKSIDIYGNLSNTGNIAMGGNLIFGAGPESPDKIAFGTPIHSDIIPDINDTFNIGTDTQRMGEVHTYLLNGELVNAQTAAVDDVQLEHRAGNIIYVAENGDDGNRGDHPQGPFGTLKRALEFSDASVQGPVTIHIFPGTYLEEFPLEVPSQVTVAGTDLRNTIIKPTTATRYNDAFLLNGEATVQDLSIQDFYSGGNFFEITEIVDSTTIKVNVGTGPYAHAYESGGTVDFSDSTSPINVTNATYDHTTGELTIELDALHDSYVGHTIFLTSITWSCNGGFRNYPDNGYAFKFAPNTVVTTRSPYIQNITVITKGSITSADDPRGYDAGDAGKGAYIDGARVSDASRNASMLFHAATFITPGVDAITLTNGVRIEWLNSFTYFANRGLYAKRNEEGHLSEDGSTINYGAEIRSIGSASVYGNIGAEADGDGCIMYLINHNFAYIGVGKDVSNDNTLVIEDNQWVEVNNGKVFIQNTDQLGKFRVGDDFFVDLQTGETSIATDGVALDGLSQIVIGTGEDQTILNDSFVQTGDIRFAGNTIFSLVSDLNVDSVSTNTNFNSNVLMDKNVDITGNFTIDGTLNTFGNQPEDTVDFNVDIDQDFYPEVDRVHSLGSSTKLWDNVYTDEFNIDDIKIFDNVITTTISNANLDLKSNQTGYVQTEDLIWQNNTIGSYESDIVFSTTGNLIINNAQGLIVPRGTNAERVETTGSIRYSNQDSLFEGWGNNRITFGGVYSTDRETSIFTQPDESIDINVDGTKVGEINNEGFTLHGLQSDSVLINNNLITSSESNADLELRRKGDQQVTLNRQEYFRDNIWTNPAEEENLTFVSTDRGYVKIAGTYGVVVGTTGGVITDNVNDLTIGTDTSTSLLFETDNAGRIDQAETAPTGDGEFTTTGAKTFASTTSGVQNFFLDFDILDITNIYEIEITGIRFRGNFDKDSQFVDVTFPQPGGTTYVTRVGEFEDAGDTSTFTQSLVFNAVPQGNRLYVHTGTTKSSFESQIVLDSGSYGMNISIDVPASISTPPTGMTNNWELEISYRYITINNKFDEYDAATNNYYYIFDQDSSNLSDNDRYIVTETQIEPSFRRARFRGKIIVGSDSNGSGLYSGQDILIQYSDDGTNDTGMITLGRIVDANEFASFGTWRDFEFSFEFLDSTLIDFNNLRFRIVQPNGGRLGENSWAVTDLQLSITRRADEPAPIGGFRYDPIQGLCEVWDGTSWQPATGIEEDPVTEEFMQELVGLYSIVLG